MLLRVLWSIISPNGSLSCVPLCEGWFDVVPPVCKCLKLCVHNIVDGMWVDGNFEGR